jgi:hypothetical protein
MKNLILSAFLIVIYSCGGDAPPQEKKADQIIISHKDLLDYTEKYLNKTVTVKDLQFFQSHQPDQDYLNGYELSLRSGTNDSESLRALNFYSSFINENDSDKYYYRTVWKEIYITLKIPKNISSSLPNIYSSSIDVTGQVISSNLIIVTAVKRSY